MTVVTWDSLFQGVECHLVLVGPEQNLLSLHGQVGSLTQLSFVAEHPPVRPLRGPEQLSKPCSGGHAIGRQVSTVGGAPAADCLRGAGLERPGMALTPEAPLPLGTFAALLPP